MRFEKSTFSDAARHLLSSSPPADGHTHNRGLRERDYGEDNERTEAATDEEEERRKKKEEGT
jgi:hypothetical protein